MDAGIESEPVARSGVVAEDELGGTTMLSRTFAMSLLRCTRCHDQDVTYGQLESSVVTSQ